MGSDRKSKEKKSKKRNSYSSGSEDERKSKRHRTEEDGDRKSRKSDKKEKRTDKKFQKKSKDKHKSKHHRSDRHLEVQVLSNDDYFSKNNEFATWLKEEKNVFFSDLSSESAHEHFSYFVKAWNDQKLETRYYEGISSGPRTSHNWKIRK
ncbi:style cell-cycle inhibitor 1 isoform X4 [Alnus glutinosa]|uniref:style cell-cycle inhibitor 1 isoform X4 n=1 Tax=Alnus glutinosa TaxID=3517 RepID=UPI002D76655D|nr:style cell-cycle inhibitor 1 isoform X4 [Alnus glutinosa]